MRCTWSEKNQLLREYHDKEWGKPKYQDDLLFECLILEIMQAGLSWEIILKKREQMKKACDNFNFERIANYDEQKLIDLMNDERMIRHRLKIDSLVKNAQAFISIRKEFDSFSQYIWSFVNHQPIINVWHSLEEVPSSTILSEQISQDLKKRGFKFVGPKVVYSYMQSIGLVNDHISGCFYK